MPKPPPLKLVERNPGLTSEYVALASGLGFQTADMIENSVVEFMRNNDIPRYSTSEVEAYMDRLAIAANTSWCWKRLRDGQKCPLGNDFHVTSGTKHGWTSDKQALYGHPVPIEMLRRATKLAGAFPELGFFVSDYTSEQPDPFIMCWHPGMKDLDRVVFGVWDEPGFGS